MTATIPRWRGTLRRGRQISIRPLPFLPLALPLPLPLEPLPAPLSFPLLPWPPLPLSLAGVPPPEVAGRALPRSITIVAGRSLSISTSFSMSL
ncbi:MAG: hypothetical protein E6J90_07555 [Deltaproteobacteria bacterium]|nr:MAG: hypothetical protein E6J90_07555 [Deltaproteobacteria bacterium]